MNAGNLYFHLTAWSSSIRLSTFEENQLRLRLFTLAFHDYSIATPYSRTVRQLKPQMRWGALSGPQSHIDLSSNEPPTNSLPPSSGWLSGAVNVSTSITLTKVVEIEEATCSSRSAQCWKSYVEHNVKTSVMSNVENGIKSFTRLISCSCWPINDKSAKVLFVQQSRTQSHLTKNPAVDQSTSHCSPSQSHIWIKGDW